MSDCTDLSTALWGAFHEAAAMVLRNRATRHHPRKKLSTKRHIPRVSNGPSAHCSAEIRIDNVLRHAWAKSTLAKYRDGLSHFHDYCDQEGINHEFCIPASEFLLCAFASASAGIRSGVATRNDLSGIRAWHIINDEHYMGGTRLNYVVKGVEALHAASSKQPPRSPITIHMLELLSVHLDFSSHLDICVFACALVTFWTQSCLGEILSKTQSWIKSSHDVPTLADLYDPITLGGSRKLFLPRTKTTGSNGANAFITAQYGPANPIPALERHVQMNAPPPGVPLFAYCVGEKHFCLTSKKFLVRCNMIWARFGLPSSTGHSLRIGGTTELLIRRVPPNIVKMLGRWKSDAFLAYWRSLELIAPLYAEYLEPLVTSVLPPVQI